MRFTVKAFRFSIDDGDNDDVDSIRSGVEYERR